jgi:hypothetical protein
MSDLSARHDAIIREAIEVHRGQVVKTTGEGIKGSSRGFTTDARPHSIPFKLHSYCQRKYFGDALYGKFLKRIANLEEGSVDGLHGHAKFLGRDMCQFGNVVGNLPLSKKRLDLVVDFFKNFVVIHETNFARLIRQSLD